MHRLLKDGSIKSADQKRSVPYSDDQVGSADSEHRAEHKLATIMFSDICGFTKMMGDDEARTMQIVARNKVIHQECLNRYKGTLIKEMGDGLLASFTSAHDAVHCAREIMAAAKELGTYSLHIGIHLGDIIFTKEDVYGDGVNIAARLNAKARAGEIIISADVWQIIANPPEFITQYLGQRTLKNVSRPVKIYKVLLDDEKIRLQFRTIYYRNKKSAITVLIMFALLLSWLTMKNLAPIMGSYTRDDISTIAVLPFENRAENEGYDYLVEGLAEDIIGQLLEQSSITVISSRSSFQYKSTTTSIRQISRDLKADIILTGNFDITNDQLKVKYELVEGYYNKILDYDVVATSLVNVTSVADEIGQTIFKALEIPSRFNDRASQQAMANINIEAYKYNALGRSAMYDHTGQDIEEVIQYFKKAIGFDSTYAEPYLGLAEAYIFDANRGYISPAMASQRAKEFALQAEKLQPGRGEVSALLGTINYLNGDFKRAQTYFDQALELSPNYYLTYHYYAFMLQILGDFDQALKLQKKANAIDPLNAFNDVYVALNQMFQGKLNEAHQIIDARLKIEADHSLSLWVKAILLNQEDKHQEALEYLERRAYGLTTNFVAGYTYAMLGREAEARNVLENMLRAANDSYVPPTQIAIVYCGLGEREKAIEYVEEAFLIHDVWIGYLKYTSFSEAIKDDPRYIALMSSLGEDN